MKVLNQTPNEILAKINDEVGRKLTNKIFTVFLDNELSYKAILIRDNYYRTYFYIKKSKEALVVNSLPDDNIFRIQFRITNWSTFEKLDDYSKNIRKAILVNNTPCRAPAPEGRYCRTACPTMYCFAYHGKEYRLCHAMCSNFGLDHLSEEDIEPFIDIINREIAFGKPNSMKFISFFLLNIPLIRKTLSLLPLNMYSMLFPLCIT